MSTMKFDIDKEFSDRLGELGIEAGEIGKVGSKSMIGLETNTLRDKSRRVAQDAEDLIKTTATWASLSNLLKGKKGW